MLLIVKAFSGRHPRGSIEQGKSFCNSSDKIGHVQSGMAVDKFKGKLMHFVG